jgi:hypothetical protein
MMICFTIFILISIHNFYYLTIIIYNPIPLLKRDAGIFRKIAIISTSLPEEKKSSTNCEPFIFGPLSSISISGTLLHFACLSIQWKQLHIQQPFGTFFYGSNERKKDCFSFIFI